VVFTPSASTRIHPQTSRPPSTIGLTWARPRSFSVSPGGTRTIRPPCPLTATAVSPLIRNALLIDAAQRTQQFKDATRSLS
jgi:hypothetical protein